MFNSQTVIEETTNSDEEERALKRKLSKLYRDMRRNLDFSAYGEIEFEGVSHDVMTELQVLVNRFLLLTNSANGSVSFAQVKAHVLQVKAHLLTFVDHKVVRDILLYLVGNAQKHVRLVFGLELFCDGLLKTEITNITPQQNSKVTLKDLVCAETKFYVIDTKLSDHLKRIVDTFELIAVPSSNHGLLMTVLALIVLNGGSVSEEEVVEALAEYVDNTEDLVPQLKALAKSEYISRTTVTGNRRAKTFNYSLKTRALVEIGIENILGFIDRIMGNAMSTKEKLTLASRVA